MGLPESLGLNMQPSQTRSQQMAEGTRQQDGTACNEWARTVRQEPDLVSVETQVWHVTVAILFHQILKDHRKCQ